MIVAPPERRRSDELELLIREARDRQRKRWLAAVFVLALLAAAVLAAYSIAAGGGSSASPTREGKAVVKSGKACGVRVDDTRIVNGAGRTIYREPGDWTPSYPHPSVVRCSRSSVWVVWDNGAASSQEAYVGVHSGDGGRSWKLVFAESYFGVRAPHELDSYLGPWTLGGPGVAYFTGQCPACGKGPVFGTVSLSVTEDGGRTFREYQVPALNGYAPTRISVSGNEVTIVAKGFAIGARPHKTVTVPVA